MERVIDIFELFEIITDLLWFSDILFRKLSTYPLYLRWTLCHLHDSHSRLGLRILNSRDIQSWRVTMMKDMSIPSVIYTLFRLLDMNNRMPIGGAWWRSKHIHLSVIFTLLPDWSDSESAFHVRQEVSTGIGRKITTGNIDLTLIRDFIIRQIIMRIKHEIMTRGTCCFKISLYTQDRMIDCNTVHLSLPILNQTYKYRIAYDAIELCGLFHWLCLIIR